MTQFKLPIRNFQQLDDDWNEIEIDQFSLPGENYTEVEIEQFH